MPTCLFSNEYVRRLAAGASPQNAINSGYEKALSSITDANITTLIAAIVLFGVGTGPIKGFAITLMLGIITSMFTAIVGTRSIVNLVFGGRKLTSLPVTFCPHRTFRNSNNEDHQQNNQD